MKRQIQSEQERAHAERVKLAEQEQPSLDAAKTCDRFGATVATGSSTWRTVTNRFASVITCQFLFERDYEHEPSEC